MRAVKRSWPGWFISFEGVDGSGKTTQLRNLGAWLRQHRAKVLETREPGGTPLAESIRDFVLDPRNVNLRPLTELFLMNAARAQHVEDGIMPALERGDIVLCDRFSDATLAYQGGGRGFPVAELKTLNAIATKGIQPDLTFLMDVPVHVGQQRQTGRGGTADRMESEPPAFHERVRQAYLEIAKSDPNRVLLIDSTRPLAMVQETIRKAVVTKKIIQG